MNGEIFRESSGSEKQSDADRLLKRRVAEVATGKFLGLAPERITLGELFKDVVEDYETYERKSTPDVISRLKNHLEPVFAATKAADFSTKMLKSYIAARRKDGAKNATINRELAIIRRAFMLASKCDPPKVARVPHVAMLKENNARSGFLEYEGYIALRDALPWFIRPIFVTGYHIGGRRGELATIEWRQVDLRGGQIRLGGDITKNEDPRTVPIYGDMGEWLALAKKIRDEKFPDCPWVFYTEEGKRLYWFYEEWDLACIEVGFPGLLFHDLRRSAVRNMERAGIPRKIAMAISGHKTESVYRRYDIVAERDFADAARRLNGYLESERAQLPREADLGTPETLGTLLGTPAEATDADGLDAENGDSPKP